MKETNSWKTKVGREWMRKKLCPERKWELQFECNKGSAEMVVGEGARWGIRKRIQGRNEKCNINIRLVKD